MELPKDKLMDLVKEGPVSDIFRAEQALSLFNTIGDVSKEVNDSTYGEVFATFQSLCIDRFVLSISKLYEKPKDFPLRSVPGVLNFLKENAEQLEIIDSYRLDNQMTRLGTDISKLIKLDAKEKTIYVADRLLSKKPKGMKKTLDPLVKLRNKHIAHPEVIDVESLLRTTWDAAETLLQYPKDVVGAISDGYLNISYVVDSGEYVLSSDASRVGRGVKRMLAELGISTSNDKI
ncbi:MAG: hypothetical protein NPINA01_13000 [Nitrospinaceae bacterium]|nr:MAG: hypothetical protein NPINA01_13000 [Nitrospinaceae bacterium]